MSKIYGKEFFDGLIDKLNALDLQNWKYINKTSGLVLKMTIPYVMDDVITSEHLHFKTKLSDYNVILEKSLSDDDSEVYPKRLILGVNDGKESLVRYTAERNERISGFFTSRLKGFRYWLYEGVNSWSSEKFIAKNDSRLIDLYNKLIEPTRRKNREDKMLREKEIEQKHRNFQDFMEK